MGSLGLMASVEVKTLVQRAGVREAGDKGVEEERFVIAAVISGIGD